MGFPIIDSHQHFWIYNPDRDTWITDDMKEIRRDFLPADFNKERALHQLEGSVVVQADPSEKENEFLLQLAADNHSILGIIGWLNLENSRLEEKLEYYQQFPVVKGFRNLLQGEKQRDSLLNPAFQHGISKLNKYGYSYDLLILPDQLGFAEELVRRFPDQRFVIDHLAKPGIRNGEIAAWRLSMQRFAGLENVYCKISGMVTEADWAYWEEKDFHPFLDVIIKTFGTKRIMFGSDWPVCLPSATYGEVKEIVVNYFSAFSESENAGIFGANAIRFYKLT